MKQFKFTVNMPPSTNRIWRNYKGRTVKSAEYRDWLKAAQWQFLETLDTNRPSEPLSGPVALSIAMHSSEDQRTWKRDLDSVIKPIGDLLEYVGLVLDDNQVRRILATRNEPMLTGHCRVTLSELP